MRGAPAARTLRGGVGRAAPLLLLLLTAAVYLLAPGRGARLSRARRSDHCQRRLRAGHHRPRAGRDVAAAVFPRRCFYGSWFMPMIYYGMALALQVLPFVEWAIRLPTVLAGIVSIALTYSSDGGYTAIDSRRLVAAFVLACAPAFFILSRYALDYTLAGAVHSRLAVVPADRARPPAIATGGSPRLDCASASAGTSYISSMVMMPVYVAMTARRDRRPQARLA